MRKYFIEYKNEIISALFMVITIVIICGIPVSLVYNQLKVSEISDTYGSLDEVSQGKIDINIENIVIDNIVYHYLSENRTYDVSSENVKLRVVVLNGELYNYVMYDDSIILFYQGKFYQFVKE